MGEGEYQHDGFGDEQDRSNNIYLESALNSTIGTETNVTHERRISGQTSSLCLARAV